MKRNTTNKAGFTLIELMAVVIVLAIIAAVALPKYIDFGDDSRESSTKGTLDGVRAGVAMFYANGAINSTSRYPDIGELTDGSVMQESIPDNPYNDSAAVAAATSAQAASRTVGGAQGWRYFDGGGANKAIFYANTSGDSENDF